MQLTLHASVQLIVLRKEVVELGNRPSAANRFAGVRARDNLAAR